MSFNKFLALKFWQSILKALNVTFFNKNESFAKRKSDNDLMVDVVRSIRFIYYDHAFARENDSKNNSSSPVLCELGKNKRSHAKKLDIVEFYFQLTSEDRSLLT